MLKYHREPWPANIIGDKADYWIESNGNRIGFIRVNRAGRQAGRFTHWTAHNNNGEQIAFATTMRDLKTTLDKLLR